MPLLTTSADSPATATEDLLPRELRVAVTRLARRLRQTAGADLTPSLAAALHTIERHGPLTPSEVAARERVQRPTATRVLAKLVALGLVAREEHPADGRSHRVVVTPAGHALIAEGRRRKDEALAAALARLPAEDRATLARAAALLDGLLEEAP